MLTGDEPSTTEQMQEFIYLFDAVQSTSTDRSHKETEKDKRIVEEHIRYLKRAAERGQLILSGTSVDGAGPEVVVFEALTVDEARRFMQEDPLVSAGVVHARLHPFRPLLVRRG